MLMLHRHCASFHADSIVIDATARTDLSVSVAEALFRYHLDKGHLNARTAFDIPRSSGPIRDTIMKCIRAWEATTRTRTDDSPRKIRREHDVT